MRIVDSSATVFTIFDAPKLDPITVVIQDVGPGCGRLFVECFGNTWSNYWGAIGDCTLFEFLCDCSPDYISGKMQPLDRKMTKREIAYLEKIISAVWSVMNSPYFD